MYQDLTNTHTWWTYIICYPIISNVENPILTHNVDNID